MKITRKTFLALSLALLTTFSVVSVPCYAAPAPAAVKAAPKKVMSKIWSVIKRIVRSKQVRDHAGDIAELAVDTYNSYQQHQDNQNDD